MRRAEEDADEKKPQHAFPLVVGTYNLTLGSKHLKNRSKKLNKKRILFLLLS